MIETNYGEILNAGVGLSRIKKHEFDIVTQFRISRFFDEFDKHYEKIEKVRNELIEKYGTEDENGNKIIRLNDKDNVVKYYEDLNEVGKETVQLNCEKINIDLIKDIKIDNVMFTGLKPFLTDIVEIVE